MSDLAAAKKRLIDELGEEPWLTAIGIGLVGTHRQKGLIVSVSEGAPEDVDARVARLVPGVAVHIRGLQRVHKLSTT